MIQNRIGIHDITITGRIEPPDVLNFEELATTIHNEDKVPYADIIVFLHSDGGNLDALAIGDYIHNMGMQTYVPANTRCMSLCAYFWLAGSQRGIGQNAQLGFHMAHPIPGQRVNIEEYVAANAAIALYFGHLHMGYAFLDWVLSAGQGIKLLTSEAAGQFGIRYSSRQ
jgi:hypothetical protein